MEGVVAMEEYFWLCSSHGQKPATFSLDQEGITVTETTGRLTGCISKAETGQRILFSQVIGCHGMKSRSNKSSQQLSISTSSTASSTSSQSSVSSTPSQKQHAFICIYWYPLKTSPEGVHQILRKPVLIKVAKHRTYTENLAVADRWRKVIMCLVRGMAIFNLEKMQRYLALPQKPILFLVNPKSGSGKSMHIFNNLVLPILSEAGAHFELVTTTHSNHGRDLVATQDLSRWRGIVVVSGDGLVHEVFNGLFERDDWAESCKIPVGVIPGGSGNGLANSIAYANNEVMGSAGLRQACLRAVRCRPQPMDIVCVEGMGGPMYACLSVGWGIISDIDIESERLRFLGESRFTLWSIHRVAHFRYYKGRLSYLQAEGHQPSDEVRTMKKSGSILKKSKTIQEPSNSRAQSAPPRSSSIRERYFSVAETHFESIANESESVESIFQDVESVLDDDQMTYHSLTDWTQFSSRPSTTDRVIHTPDLGTPSIYQPVPASWVTLEDEFVVLYAVHQSYITSSSCMAPASQLDDGIIWLITIRRGSFPNRQVPLKVVAQFFLKLEKGEQGFLSGVEMIPVRAFRLEPLEERGYITVDGELIPMGTIQAAVLPSLVRIIN